MAPNDGEQLHRDHGPGAGIYLAFVPWVLFTLITQHDSLKAAAIIALIGAAGIAIRSAAGSGPKLLEVGAVAAFAGFTIVAFTVDASTAHWVERYARAIAASLLALIAFGSLPFTPFTEQYARASVPREFWSSSRFRQVNRQLTLMWALVFTTMVVSHVIAGATTHGAPTRSSTGSCRSSSSCGPPSAPARSARARQPRREHLEAGDLEFGGATSG